MLGCIWKGRTEGKLWEGSLVSTSYILGEKIKFRQLPSYIVDLTSEGTIEEAAYS